MVAGEWMPWPIRSILPRDLALEVLLRCNNFPQILTDYIWRLQEGYDGQEIVEESDD